MNCPKCGNPIAPNMKFCAKCGTAVAQAQPQQNTPPMQARPTAPKEMPNVPPMQSFPVNNVQPAPDKKKNKPKKKKNIGLKITAIVLAVAVLLTGGIFIFDSVLYKKSLEGAEYIEDFPVLKQKTELTVIDSEKFPVEEYNIKVEKMKMGGVLKSGKILKNDTVIDDDATTPTYNIDFKEDGNYVITLTEIVASRTQPTETTEPSTQEESTKPSNDKSEESKKDKKDKDEPIIIIIEVKVDDSDENAAERVDLNKNTGDKVPTVSTEPSKDTSDGKQEEKPAFIEATESDFEELEKMLSYTEANENLIDSTQELYEMLFNSYAHGYEYFFGETEFSYSGRNPNSNYVKLPKENVKWICEKIYNFEFDENYVYEIGEYIPNAGYVEGDYCYVEEFTGGDWGVYDYVIADKKVVGDKYEVVLDLYMSAYVGGAENGDPESYKTEDAIKVTVALKEDNGERYWSIYKIEKYDSASAPSTETNSGTANTAPSVSGAKVGEYITFGKYEQDGNTSNGAEDIEWLVLDVQDGKVLVISKYALETKKYNEEQAAVTWETCTLRNWLNNDFYSTAFSSGEKGSIVTTNVIAEDNPEYGTDGGNDTQDKVFLLSISEAEKYFGSDDERTCKPTQYAINQGAFRSTDSSYYGNGQWWLRSPGGNLDDASDVYDDGRIYDYGHYASLIANAVRPAMWVKLG